MPARSRIVAVVSFGLVRGLAWARDIRFFTIAAALVLLYTLGGYTPAFHFMYDLLPGVALYRRPADATFVLGALFAIIAGYLVHRWLTGTVPRATRLQRRSRSPVRSIVIAAALAAGAFGGRHPSRRSFRWQPRPCSPRRRSPS